MFSPPEISDHKLDHGYQFTQKRLTASNLPKPTPNISLLNVLVLDIISRHYNEFVCKVLVVLNIPAESVAASLLVQSGSPAGSGASLLSKHDALNVEKVVDIFRRYARALRARSLRLDSYLEEIVIALESWGV
ncbi:hypothetical protein AAF712_015872 [Marasmius tenuissimus]|uniref:Uncharacterized protein n=1 Tax=Marasmius tenuissimus TaxID=585030 RepID=A0ABR2Z868_9AGAR